mgnify:CR=1 FL=1
MFDKLDFDKVARKTILDMVDSGELTRESMIADGASEKQVDAFFNEDVARIRRELAEDDI